MFAPMAKWSKVLPLTAHCLCFAVLIWFLKVAPEEVVLGLFGSFRLVLFFSTNYKCLVSLRPKHGRKCDENQNSKFHTVVAASATTIKTTSAVSTYWSPPPMLLLFFQLMQIFHIIIAKLTTSHGTTEQSTEGITTLEITTAVTSEIQSTGTLPRSEI